MTSKAKESSANGKAANDVIIKRLRIPSDDEINLYDKVLLRLYRASRKWYLIVIQAFKLERLIARAIQ